MSEAEREHWDHELNARADYLSEAFGAEARLLAAQAWDEAIEGYGYFSQSGWEAHGIELTARARAAKSIAKRHTPVVVDDVPF